MYKMVCSWFCIFVVLISSVKTEDKVIDRDSAAQWGQDWGYVTVRPEAHMFWWFYETTSASVSKITEKPLVIWLQGDLVGSSATSHGNFAEIGPLDIHLKPRNHTWVKDVNLLFIDSPVGSGFSYTENNQALATTNKQISEDLLTCILGFYKKQPQFRHVPLYIVSESYGGKMAVEFALEVDQFNKNGNEVINLLGITLIDSWISPVDSVLNYAPYLYNLGVIDSQGQDAINKVAPLVKMSLEEEDFEFATEMFEFTLSITLQQSHNINLFNYLKQRKSSRLTGVSCDENLNEFMDWSVKTALGLSGNFGAQRKAVKKALKGDMMKSVTHIVENLLNNTNIKIQVVSGQLDIIVNTPGTLQWVENLKWSDRTKWNEAYREILTVNEINEGYEKKFGKFSVYWVNRAGQRVPADNPAAMGAILKDLLSE